MGPPSPSIRAPSALSSTLVLHSSSSAPLSASVQGGRAAFFRWVLMRPFRIAPLLFVVALTACKTADSFPKRYAQDLKLTHVIAEAFQFYYLKHGQYPELPDFRSIVEGNSPLVAEGLLPAGTRTQDSWGQPFAGFSTKWTFKLECLGDPGDQKKSPGFVREPQRLTFRSTRTPLALSSAPSQHSASSAPLIASLQTGSVSFIR